MSEWNGHYVKENPCECSNEVCVCDMWAIHAPDGQKLTTEMSKSVAEEAADNLNSSFLLNQAVDILKKDKN